MKLCKNDLNIIIVKSIFSYHSILFKASEEWNRWANEQPWAEEWNKWNEKMKTAGSSIVKRNRKREVKTSMNKKDLGTVTSNPKIRLEDSDTVNINKLYDLPDDDIQDESWWMETSGEVS